MARKIKKFTINFFLFLVTILSYPNKKIIFSYTHALSIALGKYLVSCTKCSVHVALNEPFVSWTKGVFLYFGAA